MPYKQDRYFSTPNETSEISTATNCKAKQMFFMMPKNIKAEKQNSNSYDMSLKYTVVSITSDC